MLTNPLLLIGISVFFAGVPVAVWISIFFSKKEKSKKTIAAIFALGCLTAPALLGIQYLWEEFPKFNLASFIENTVQTQSLSFILTFVLFGAMEEIIKMYVVMSVDKRTLLINSIGDSIRYSITAALGFSFIENVYYLYQFWPSISIGELAGMYIFRSIFTTCAHMIFSGIFGYYYGIGKFSIDISKQQALVGKKSFFAGAIANFFSLPISQAYQQNFIVTGLFTAVFMHAVYNYLLQMNIILPVIIFVLLGYFYLRFLLNRKTGHLLLNTDISTKRKSSMAMKDEEVVLELLGMWTKEKRYNEVKEICERLLERDPDNNVVKLFRAQAQDKLSKKI